MLFQANCFMRDFSGNFPGSCCVGTNHLPIASNRTHSLGIPLKSVFSLPTYQQLKFDRLQPT
jgi:hypothetical protein